MDILPYFSYVVLVMSSLSMIFSFTPEVKADGGSASIDERDSSPSYFFYQQRVNPLDCKELQSQCVNNAMNYTGVFLIQPVGSLEPFQVYCDNDFDLGGWTVIQRRKEFSLGFTRNWTDYKTGFGFSSTEFWIGNDNLAYLTNQAVCELRIDIILSNGSSFYIKYDSFRISDEWSQYTLVSVGRYEGNATKVYSTCPSNMTYGSCRCQPTCNDPQGNSCSFEECPEDETCICSDGFLRLGDECVLARECGCFLVEIDRVIANNTSYVNADCSEKCTCVENQLSCNLAYECGSDAYCGVVDDTHQCYCNDGYASDGETCRLLYRDCYDVLQDGQINDGIYTVLPSGWPGAPFNVYCDMATAGGGWTLFQRRIDGVTDFYRNWTSYKHGFGSLDHDKDFWLGNEQLYYLTNQRDYKLRIEITTPEQSHEERSLFRIGAENIGYQILDIGELISGTQVNGMPQTTLHPFSTFDMDNDGCEDINCAEGHRGGWWYSDWCRHCHGSYCASFQYSDQCHIRCTLGNLNGDWNGASGDAIFWDYHPHYPICGVKSAEMKIRPVL